VDVDTIITQVTEAPSTAHAWDVMNAIRSPFTLRAVADQLYIDPEGHSLRTLRGMIIQEARSWALVAPYRNDDKKSR
jgi:hypothetical protein